MFTTSAEILVCCFVRTKAIESIQLKFFNLFMSDFFFFTLFFLFSAALQIFRKKTVFRKRKKNVLLNVFIFTYFDNYQA